MPTKQQQMYAELFHYAKHLPKLNTHCHQLPPREFKGFDLDALLRNSYVNWIGIPWDHSSLSRSSLLEKIHFNSFFVWLQKSLCELYDDENPLSESNWQIWNERIQTAYQDVAHSEKILTESCASQSMILDAYWNPGSDNANPTLFMPTFRVNAFFFGYSMVAADHDGNNPYRLYPRAFILDLDEYVAWVRDCVLSYKASGCVALKLPIAYDRGLDFRDIEKEKAQKAFSRLTAKSPRMQNQIENTNFPVNAPTYFSAQASTSEDADDVKTFQDYLFFQLCCIASETDLPLQIHTGMGQGFHTNALQLQQAIQKFPETQFVILHCSYPWIEDMSLLVSNYPNVYPDLSWVPLLSTTAATRLLHELIERSTIDRICWGCDTWSPEESYGSLLAFCHTLASTLARKTIDGYFSTQDAYRVIDHILFDNPCRLYKLPEMDKSERRCAGTSRP